MPEKVGVALDRLLPGHSGAHIGVAVSGGPDSVALCHALVTLAPKRDLKLTVLHVNHALRPETNQEQHLVETLCQGWHLPCYVETLTPPASRSGIEAWARKERYRFFCTMRARAGLTWVAVAHTLDDQAETVLFRLLRGSARRGLAGIPPTRNGWLIRPLLGCSHKEVLAYLTAHHLPCVTDPSNTDLRYARNRIRHRLIPLLEREFSPHVGRRLAALAETWRVEEAWLETLATNARMRVQDTPSAVCLDRLALEPPALRSRVLRQWLEQSRHTHDLGFVHLDGVQALSEGRTRGSVALPGNVRVHRREHQLVLEKQGPHALPAPFCYPLIPGQEVLVAQSGWRVMMGASVEWKKEPEQARLPDPWQALFDIDAVPGTLMVRSFQPGDRISPLGMGGHHKKVHDVFIDAKIPARLRPTFPLVVHGDTVVWVPGCVRAEEATVTPATHRVCQVVVHPLPEKYKLC